MFCWALAFGFHPTPQRASVVIGAALTKKPPTPEGQGGRTVKHRAMCKARRLIRRVLTLVLSIWKAEIRFLMLAWVGIRLSHRIAGRGFDPPKAVRR